MSDSVTPFAAGVVAISGVRAGEGRAAAAPEPDGPAPAQPPVRLMVQGAPETGYVYRIMDALTGLLIAEIQRQEAGSLDPSSYVAGTLVSTKV